MFALISNTVRSLLTAITTTIAIDGSINNEIQDIEEDIQQIAIEILHCKTDPYSSFHDYLTLLRHVLQAQGTYLAPNASKYADY